MAEHLRRIADVLSAMLKVVPESEREFRAKLDRLCSDAWWVAPEAQKPLWFRAQEILIERFGVPPPTEGWGKEVVDIFMGPGLKLEPMSALDSARAFALAKADEFETESRKFAVLRSLDATNAAEWLKSVARDLRESCGSNDESASKLVHHVCNACGGHFCNTGSGCSASGCMCDGTNFSFSKVVE